MKALFALTLLAVACAISVPEEGAQYGDELNIVDLPNQELEGSLVEIVNVADPNFAGDENVEFGDDSIPIGIGPTELESVRIELPEGYDPVLGFQYDDPMWR